MERIAKALADLVYQSESPFCYEIYQYGLQVALEMLVALIAGCCIAVSLDMKLEGCIFLILFSVLRSYAGGLHFSGFLPCFLCSLMINAGALLFVKMCEIQSVGLCALMGFFTLAFWVTEPANSKNKAVTDKESEYYKKKLKRVLVFLCIVFLMTLFAGQTRYANLMVVTTMVTFVLMLIGRWKDRYECANDEK